MLLHQRQVTVNVVAVYVWLRARGHV